MKSNPKPLSLAEWDEVAALPLVRECWGLEADQKGREFSQVAYGAKFAFVSGSPGFCGEVIVILGDCLGNPPVLFARDLGGALQSVDFAV
jgi:hypothetical protein